MVDSSVEMKELRTDEIDKQRIKEVYSVLKNQKSQADTKQTSISPP